MQAQIEEDLAPFYDNGVTSRDIDRTIDEVLRIPSGRQMGLVRYQIRDNRITVTSPTESLNDARIAHVVEVLSEMAKQLELPDVEFLASIWDSYDNPLHLEKTYCPVFTICKMKTNRRAVLFPEFRHFSYREGMYKGVCDTSDGTPWEEKFPLAVWRGMSSGFNYTLLGWDTRPRSRLVLFSQEHPELIDAAFTSPYSLSHDVKTVMEKYGLFKPWGYVTAFVKYKYLVSIDGNTFASNYWWQLVSNCAVLKSESEYIEWFYKGFSPFVHYVPYELDLSDFGEKLKWLMDNDVEAKQIADNASDIAREHLSNAALVVYFYRLLQAYSELLKSRP